MPQEWNVCKEGQNKQESKQSKHWVWRVQITDAQIKRTEYAGEQHHQKNKKKALPFLRRKKQRD
jgi:hypothetical protein